MQVGGALLKLGTKGGDRGSPLAPPPGDRTGGGDTHLAVAVSPASVTQGLQDVAGDVALVPPPVLHEPPLLLRVQDLMGGGDMGWGGQHPAVTPFQDATHGETPQFVPAVCPPS